VCYYITQELLNRINELTRKKRKFGLSPEEMNEHKQLYQEYITSLQGKHINLPHKLEGVIYNENKNNNAQDSNKVFQQTQIILGQRIFH